MKKRIWILTLALALMLTGCGQKQAAPSEEAPQQGQEEPVQEEGQQTPADQAVYEDAQLTEDIRYPQLTRFPGELLMEYMNESLARPAKTLEKYDTRDAKALDYTVTRCDAEWVSVLFTRTLTAEDGAVDQVMIGMNLSGETAAEATMDNTFTDPAAVTALLEQQPDGDLGFYMDETGVVFFFRPGNDPAKDYVIQTVSYEQLEGLWKESVGERPAS